MSLLRVINETRRTVLGGRIKLADSLLARLRGFLFRRPPEMGEGLLLTPCRGVHMYGMRFPLDVVLLDRNGAVVAAHAMLGPGERTPVYRDARHALELPAGTIAATATAVGDRLAWQPAGSAMAAEQGTLRMMRQVYGGGP